MSAGSATNQTTAMACESCAEMEWWGSFAERLCSFKPGMLIWHASFTTSGMSMLPTYCTARLINLLIAGMVRFTYDSHSKSLVGTMVNDRDAGGVSMCRPLGNVLVLGATLAGDGHLGHALVVQVASLYLSALYD